MPPTIASPLEQAESVSPSSAAFTMYEARSVRPCWYENPTLPVDLQTLLPLFLGDTDLAVQPTTTMNRTPPVADPVWPYLYCSSVSNVRGAGQYTNQPGNDRIEVPTLPRMPFYQSQNPGGAGVRKGGYYLDLEFTPRPYAVAANSQISPTVLHYFDTSGVSKTLLYSPEWLRYTDFDYVPAENYITARQGAFVFRETGLANGKAFDGMPRLYLPDQTLRFRWTGVPYRYITSQNSYIEANRGRVNQLFWYNWNIGSLLYQNYSVTRYTPPVPRRVPFNGGGGGKIFSAEKLVDIEFYFLLTRRAAANPPIIPSNANWVAFGHNLHPWFFDRGFHYATAQGLPLLPATWVPSYLSFPVQQLFVDPDFPQ
jgi:hypothetical protein